MVTTSARRTATATAPERAGGAAAVATVGGDRQGNERLPEGGGEPREREYSGEPIEIEGLLDLRDEGYGFLRTSGYLPGRNDVYVSASQVRRFALRKGDYVKGATRPPRATRSTRRSCGWTRSTT